MEITERKKEDGHYLDIRNEYEARYFDTYIENELVKQNEFIAEKQKFEELPVYDSIKDKLPQVVWENHPDETECYDFAWKSVFGHLRKCTAENGFVRNYIDTAFNGNIFINDSTMMSVYSIYGGRQFPFHETLDNFYCKQHPDGFICREIRGTDGGDRFHRHDINGAGPYWLAWAEWEHYLWFKDKERVRKVFPALLAFFNWIREHRTWKDGTYYQSGLGCTMDNQPRVDNKYSSRISHGFMTWLDTNLQIVLSDKILVEMAKLLGRENEVALQKIEIEFLTDFINKHMWDDRRGFYFDLRRDGTRNDCKSVAAFWALWADVCPSDRKERLIGHLKNEKEFNRFHRVPSISADAPAYCARAGYWRGGVWAPVNYFILKGLTLCGEHELAAEIAENTNRNVAKVYKDTGTIWEVYSPESNELADETKPDFTGWSAMPAINFLIEYVLGLQREKDTLVWHVHQCDRHGVKKFPFGKTGTFDLICEKRKKGEKPTITVKGNEALKIKVVYENGEFTVNYDPGN